MKLNYYLSFFSLVLFVSSSKALVSCGPTSCTPVCGSTCTYYACSSVVSATYTITSLPVNTMTPPSNACSFNVPIITQIPFSLSGITYYQLPATVSVSYSSCQSFVNVGPACM